MPPLEIRFESFEENILKILEVWGTNLPFLLAPDEGLGPSGPAGIPFWPSSWPLAPGLRIKSYLYSNIVVMVEITKITITPSILVKLTLHFFCIILRHSTKKYNRPIAQNRDQKK